MSFYPNAYGDVFAPLLSDERLNPLDGGEPNSDARGALEALSIESAFAGKSIEDPLMAEACLSGAWLYHNYLDTSHTISQGIDSETGSFWHGIMHRREPDFPNSKYWFRKVGTHPVFADLAREAEQMAGKPYSTSGKGWDPFAFVDLCEAALSGDGDETLCRKIQRREFELLFDFSHRLATAK